MTSLLGVTPETPNASRNGFVHNCYTTGKGKFFQFTVKHTLLASIKKIHGWAIPRYSKGCGKPYVYDDPRLKNLNLILKRAFAQHMDDNDAERKREIGGMAADIVLFLMKEDIFYRMVIMRCIQDIAKSAIANPDLFALTAREEYTYQRFRGMNYNGKPIMSTQGQPLASFPVFDVWVQDPVGSVERWKQSPAYKEWERKVAELVK